MDHLVFRSSFSRLESLGFIQRYGAGGMYDMDGIGADIYALLLDGKKFYERLQEITG
jgi:hypothetical protein